MARLASKRAVKRKRPRSIHLEFERGRSARRHAFADAVLVDRKAVGNVVAAHRKLHQVVLSDLDAGGRVLEVLRHNGELTPVGSLILREKPDHGRTGDESTADADKDEPERAARHSHVYWDAGRTPIVRPSRFSADLLFGGRGRFLRLL